MRRKFSDYSHEFFRDASAKVPQQRVQVLVEGRGSRVEGRGSRVEGRGSRVEGRGSRVEGRGRGSRSRVEVEGKKMFFWVVYIY